VLTWCVYGCVQLKCCGSASYEDWYEIDWSGTGVVDAVPRSCCNQTAVTAEHQCDGTAVDDIYTVVRSTDCCNGDDNDECAENDDI